MAQGFGCLEECLVLAMPDRSHRRGHPTLIPFMIFPRTLILGMGVGLVAVLIGAAWFVELESPSAPQQRATAPAFGLSAADAGVTDYGAPENRAIDRSQTTTAGVRVEAIAKDTTRDVPTPIADHASVTNREVLEETIRSPGDDTASEPSSGALAARTHLQTRASILRVSRAKRAQRFAATETSTGTVENAVEGLTVLEAKEPAASVAETIDAKSSAIVAERRDAMEQITRAFMAHSDPEAKAQFLAAGQELASKEDVSMHSLLALALQPKQPAGVQHQALSLAASLDPILVQNVAANVGHPLQQQAEAILLQIQTDEAPLP